MVIPEKQVSISNVNMDIKVTEVSLSFVVLGIPKTHVGKEMPFVANTTGDDVERVIPTLTSACPWWVHDPQPGTARFVYSCSLQDVECSYSGARSTVAFQGIKYKNMDKFNGHIDTVMNLIGVEPAGPTTTRYKAVAKADLRAPWDQDVMANVITNDPDMVQSMAVCERMSTLGNRRLFSAVIDVGNEVCRVALTHADNQIVAMMSKLPDEDASLRAADVLKRLIAKYESKWKPVPSLVKPVDVAVHGIRELRDKLPELFVNNYTRECPILPIMVPELDVHKCSPKRVILYPMDGEYARYYTAPEGYFVGLKRNRLANKSTFPCLVTCYLQDHMERKGSETQAYYAAAGTVEKSGRKKPLPKSISNPSYHRKRATSFHDAVEQATGWKTGQFPWCPQVVRQELWDWQDDDIMAAITGSTEVGSCIYRYFEELVGVSIHVVVIKDGNFESLVPRHRGKYVWSPPYPLHIVVFETHKTTYGNRSCCYDYLTKGSATMFDDGDNVVSHLTVQKAADSVLPAQLEGVCEQVVDRNGKCCRVKFEDDRQELTFTRPMAVPVVPEPASFFDFHVRKMNVAKHELGLKPLDLSKRSNNDVLYFPNEASFVRYVDIHS
jgi:hypothetical protein